MLDTQRFDAISVSALLISRGSRVSNRPPVDVSERRTVCALFKKSYTSSSTTQVCSLSTGANEAYKLDARLIVPHCFPLRPA